MKATTITLSGIEQHYNPEAATAGAACKCNNLRPREGVLQVTGLPASTTAIAAGDRLLAIDGDRFITLRDGHSVMWGSTQLARVEGTGIAVHVVGNFLVITTRAERIYLYRTSSGYNEVAPTGAVPAIAIGQGKDTSMSITLPPYTFAQPLATWQYPLPSADLQGLAATVAAAWKQLGRQAADAGYRTGPVLARYAVRLWDDSYLYVSPAVETGTSCVKSSYRTSCEAEQHDGKWTGLPQCELARPCFTLAITPQAGIDEAWLGLVKSIDILVTDEAQVAGAAVLDYRMGVSNVGTRRYTIEMGPTPRPAAAIEADLRTSAWHLAARTTHVAELAKGQWIDDPVEALKLTSTDVDALVATSPQGVTASMAHNGRLYTGSAAGHIAVSRIDNPLVTAQSKKIVGGEILALAIATRPIYSGGYGRFPVYVFTGEGIFALPQLASGSYGEARIMSRKVIARGTQPAEGDGSTWFVDNLGRLCSITGAKVVEHLRDVAGTTQLAWNEAEHELAMLTASGHIACLTTTGRVYTTAASCQQLYGHGARALAVTASGQTCDLGNEQPASSQPVDYLSHPIVAGNTMCITPKWVTWNVTGRDLDLKLCIYGERGTSCHGFVVNSLHVKGNVGAPIKVPVAAQPLRALRLAVSGTAPSGTLLGPVVIAI